MIWDFANIEIGNIRPFGKKKSSECIHRSKHLGLYPVARGVVLFGVQPPPDPQGFQSCNVRFKGHGICFPLTPGFQSTLLHGNLHLPLRLLLDGEVDTR